MCIRSVNTTLSQLFQEERSAQPGSGWEYIQHCVADWAAAAMDVKPKGTFLAAAGGCALQGRGRQEAGCTGCFVTLL